MFSKAGEWGKAREQYRKLLAQTENSIDLVVFRRRPDYIAQYVDELLKHYQHDQSQEMLSEAQDLIEKYRALRPNEFNVVALEARLYKAQDHIDKARELIEATANRLDLENPDVAWKLLSNLAEQLGENQLAEKLLRRLVEKSDQPQNRLALALFLGRQGRVKEALDRCEPLWNATANPEELVGGILKVLDGDRDKTQLDRGASWLEEGLKKQPKSPVLVTGLAGIRERQGRFPDAEKLYEQVIQQEPSNVTALNNLAWLTALRNGDKNKALDLINRAIGLGGPNPELLDTRGVINTKLGNGKNAIEDLTRASDLDPRGKGPKYFHLAQAYLQAGDKQAAAKSLEKARAQGLKPDGLHALEVNAYEQVVGELGTP
jgi:tetratricopeptide (TPR) repeat protein